MYAGFYWDLIGYHAFEGGVLEGGCAVEVVAVVQWYSKSGRSTYIVLPKVFQTENTVSLQAEEQTNLILFPNSEIMLITSNCINTMPFDSMNIYSIQYTFEFLVGWLFIKLQHADRDGIYLAVFSELGSHQMTEKRYQLELKI